MGRPSIIKPVRVGSSRRAFFKNSGSAAAALVAAPLLPLAGTAAAVAINSNFQHGVASGDPLSDRVILWTRVTPTNGRSSQVVDFFIAKDPAFSQIVKTGRTKAIFERDFTVKIDATGLSPNTTYYYRFSVDGVSSPIGRTKTLPVGGVVSNLRMAVVSCSNHAYGYFNAYRRIAERADLDMVVHLGDYIYEYGNNQYGEVRATEPAHEIVTLADYRMRHAQYKRDPDSQAMHRQHPLVAIWDDHETANNAFVDGAENHQANEGTWPARVGAALQAYYEWMPVRVVDPTKPRNNARSYAFGNLVDLIMLEQRLTGRSAQLGTNIGNADGYFIQQGAYLDPARQLLGAEQESWLFNKLRGSTAKWKVLGQGVMFAQVKVQGAPNSLGGGVFFNSDAWDGYQPARNRVYDVLKGDANKGQAPVNNVVILTGDIHSSWAADLSQDPNNANLATGGYDKASGQGSRAVEFVGTSISSPGVDNPQVAAGTIAQLTPANPHLKYINLDKRGYMLIDADANRCVCEWWYVDTVASPSNIQTFATAFQVVDGSNRLSPAAQTPNRANPAALAP
ncbi:alkaline phosphatase D family protein [Roseateles sp.]|uniref:alkaline phosphatase D family protein n=1 Tax=Roseateles sp. TaxID=1971397 RepID=UPI00286C860F|nr:alkaline phosphatase D family protein [Roseateles sp.]